MAEKKQKNDKIIDENNKADVVNNSDESNNYKKKYEEAGLTKDKLMFALHTMLLARDIDTKAMNLLKQGKTFFHIAGSGHEAIQVAIAMNMNNEIDWYFPYYRDMALVLTAGVNAYEFFLQCFAKADDPASGGRQMPTHWGSRKFNLPSQSSPTGTQFLQATGTALASKRKGIKSVSYVSSGEGTTSQGEFHEAVNWASREKLPVLFCVQNNKYAISVPVQNQSGGKEHSISGMMTGYHNLLRIRLDGTDFYESYTKAKEAIEYIRAGNGPVLIEADTVRLFSHSSSDDQRKYRTEEELKLDLEKDPIEKFSKILIQEGLLSKDELEKLKQDILNEVNSSADKAFAMPDPIPADAAKHVFDESGFKEKLEYEKEEPTGPNIVMVDAINHALKEEMSLRGDMYIFGEDIADNKGGVFTATKGLSNQFGKERVFNSPLAEASIIGVAIGMSLSGLKPVVEIQFGDYIWPAFMQMKDELATMRYRSNNSWTSSVVIRVAVGGYIHGGLFHSQSIESIFTHIPGIYIAFPSNAADAKGLLKTACRINDPVLFCEHKGLYRQSYASTKEPNENYLVPFGKAKKVKEGDDLTIITYGASVWDCVIAARKLEDEGYTCDIIDLRTLVPLDVEAIYKSVKKTGKCLIVHEDTITSGFGAELAVKVADVCFENLDGPVKRIAAKDSHIPYSPILESAILPSREVIYKVIKELIMY